MGLHLIRIFILVLVCTSIWTGRVPQWEKHFATLKDFPARWSELLVTMRSLPGPIFAPPLLMTTSDSIQLSRTEEDYVRLLRAGLLNACLKSNRSLIPRSSGRPWPVRIHWTQKVVEEKKKEKEICQSQADREAQSRQGEVKVWPLTKRTSLLSRLPQLFFFFFLLRTSSWSVLGFCSQSPLIGEGTRPRAADHSPNP